MKKGIFFTIRLTEHQYEQLKEIAKNNDLSMAHLVRKSINNLIKKEPEYEQTKLL